MVKGKRSSGTFFLPVVIFFFMFLLGLFLFCLFLVVTSPLPGIGGVGHLLWSLEGRCGLVILWARERETKREREKNTSLKSQPSGFKSSRAWKKGKLERNLSDIIN